MDDIISILKEIIMCYQTKTEFLSDYDEGFNDGSLLAYKHILKLLEKKMSEEK